MKMPPFNRLYRKNNRKTDNGCRITIEQENLSRLDEEDNSTCSIEIKLDYLSPCENLSEMGTKKYTFSKLRTPKFAREM